MIRYYDYDEEPDSISLSVALLLCALALLASLWLAAKRWLATRRERWACGHFHRLIKKGKLGI